MPQTSFERVFDTREAAEAWAEAYCAERLGYSPSYSIRPSGERWVVIMSLWDSCD